MSSTVKALVFALGVQALVLIATLYFFLELWSSDLTVPFNNWGDTTWFTVVVKGLVQNGWVYDIPQLSAPFELRSAAFPIMTHTDWAVMKVLSLFNPEPGAVINLFWLCSIVFAGWMGAAAMALIGVELWLACIMGLLYALLPFAFFRNVAHINLVYYCVPGICIFALWIANGCEEARSRPIKIMGYFSILCQAFNYIYYNYFALLLFAAAGWRGAINMRSSHPIKAALMAMFITLSCASVNLTPSFVSWYQYGMPPDMGYKRAAEAETYGLKFRTMLTPSEGNSLPVLSDWAQRNRSAAFPNENENVTARLGPMAALGLTFLTLVSLGLMRTGSSDSRNVALIQNLAFLSLFVFLVATVGGLGSLLNLLVIPDFRAYNRFSVFIAFFALSAIALWWQTIYRQMKSGLTKNILILGLFLFSALSLYDQMGDAVYLKHMRPAHERQMEHLRAVVGAIEAEVELGDRIFQFPITQFPLDGGMENMLTYEHGQAYLASSKLSWSWPSFSQESKAWLDSIRPLKGRELIDALDLAGFRLIWIDGLGYRDGGAKLREELRASGAEEIFSEISERYSIFEIGHAQSQ